jgi:hypothetical protein
MKWFAIFAVLAVSLAGCSSMKINSSNYRLYQLGDMEDLLQDYYANDMKRFSPGLACGDFKDNNNVGCFKLIVDNRKNKVVNLIYDELLTGKKTAIYKFDPPVDYVYIEKIYDRKIESQGGLPEHKEVILESRQPSLRLVFFEKSAVVFYWKDGKFNEIWTSD